MQNSTTTEYRKQSPKNQATAEAYSLDLFSISQTKTEKPPKCHKNAPYICIPGESKDARLYQGCCNDWNCPRCGQLRAKHEYGRIVQGAREIAANRPLYMMTVTCRGDVDLAEAEEKYLEWTNRLNTNIRTYAQRKLGYKPEYAAVTERQDRGHPHTHYLTTFCPADAFYIVDDYERYCHEVAEINRKIPPNMRYSPDPLPKIDHRQMFSTWLSLNSVEAGLGVQCRLAVADVVEGASRYIAKYLFQTLTVEKWPEKWRRVRYSHGWPKLPEIEATGAFVVMSAHDWLKVLLLQRPVECWGVDVFEKAVRWQVFNAWFKAAGGQIVDVSNYDSFNPD